MNLKDIIDKPGTQFIFPVDVLQFKKMYRYMVAKSTPLVRSFHTLVNIEDGSLIGLGEEDGLLNEEIVEVHVGRVTDHG